MCATVFNPRLWTKSRTPVSRRPTYLDFCTFIHCLNSHFAIVPQFQTILRNMLHAVFSTCVLEVPIRISNSALSGLLRVGLIILFLSRDYGTAWYFTSLPSRYSHTYILCVVWDHWQRPWIASKQRSPPHFCGWITNVAGLHLYCNADLTLFFYNPTSFAICTSTFINRVKTNTVACSRVLRSTSW
jgi:hypothetical protein